MKRLPLVVLLVAGCSKNPPQKEPAASPPVAVASAPASVAAAAAPVVDAGAPAPKPPSCDDPAQAQVHVFASPQAPWKGAPLRVLAVSEKPIDAALAVVQGEGAAAKPLASSSERHGGPPYFWFAEVAAPPAGPVRAVLSQPGCKEPRDVAEAITVGDVPPPAPRPTWASVWGVSRVWNRALENLYSAWIEKLFDAPLEDQPSWPALHEVLRDPKRNFLHDHLGAHEDKAGDGALVIRPDCADLPYFLRAYFAFKMRLPFGYAACSRGGAGAPPGCQGFTHNLDAAAAKRPGTVASFGYFLRYTLADAVHSGSGRAPAADEGSDYYPIALGPETLRPGAVYADPYGHILVVAKRLPQTDKQGGILLAVDGQPDGTVARKRFWRGNFLFALDPALGSPGFKRFRPIVRDKAHLLRRLTTAEIKASADYGDFGLDQYGSGVEGFYDKMDDLLSPSPLDPVRAMRETIDALHEQARTRVNSLENGRKFLASGRGAASMPDGPEIFETSGAWEDFSTPSRDLRMLIAIDVVRGFPDRVARRPERYAMPAGKPMSEVKADMEKVLSAELIERKITYTRSDGTPFTLSLKDVIDRAVELEMAYNPNDCVEVRWGAPQGSDEASTCKRRAGWGQQAKMKQYRAWFHERRRPPRK